MKYFIAFCNAIHTDSDRKRYSVKSTLSYKHYKLLSKRNVKKNEYFSSDRYCNLLLTDYLYFINHFQVLLIFLPCEKTRVINPMDIKTGRNHQDICPIFNTKRGFPARPGDKPGSTLATADNRQSNRSS